MIRNDINQKVIHQDVIFINDLMLKVTLGTTEWEKQVARSVTISVAITTAFPDITGLDQVFDKQKYLSDLNCINYQEVINLISDFCINNSFFTLAEMIINLENLIINKYTTENILNIQIEITLPFPSKNLKEIGVRIERAYQQS
jgi:FolB domain-containing protein